MKLSQEVDARTLQLVEALARQFGILPPLPTGPPPVPTTTTTIGTSSRDYSTIAAWEADLDNGAVYTSGDDALGECYNDSAFSVSSTITINGGGTVGLASVRLSAASGERHDGTAGSGVRVVASSNYTPMFDGNGPANGDMTIEWLEIDANNTAIDGNGYIMDHGANGSVTVRNNVIHDTSLGAGWKYGMRCGGLNTGETLSINNNIVYDIGRTSGTGSAEVVGIFENVGTLSTKTVYVYNNTVHHTFSSTNTANVTEGMRFAAFGSELNCKNNISVDTTVTGSGSGNDFDTFSDTTNVSNNLSSDTTAPGTSAQTSKSASNQFVSTTGGSEDLHLKSGADAIDNGTDLGTTPSGVEIDIDGRDRDANADTWDIGADEYVAAGGGAANIWNLASNRDGTASSPTVHEIAPSL